MHNALFKWFGVALLAMMLLATVGCQEKAPEKSYQEKVIESSMRLMDTIVFVKSIRESYDRGKKVEYQIFGSGVVFSDTGYVLTNNHVAEKSTSLKCVLYDKTEVTATLVGADKDFDIAILQLNMEEVKSPLLVAEFGDSSALKIGDTVLALGSPLGFERSITQGIVSCDNRFLEEIPELLWLQTDAAINPGNSGGPLINVKGQVIGVNTLGIPAGYGEGIGFSIPIDIVKKYKDELIASEKITRSWTGLRLQALRDFENSEILDASEGVLIAGLDPGSPGEGAGLVSGDVLLQVGEQKIDGLYHEQLPWIYRYLMGLERGKEVAFTVRRKGEDVTVQLTPTEKKKKEGNEIEFEEWNLTVKEINQFSTQSISFYKKEGVFILGVNYDGNAYSSGLTDGDIIVSIEGKAVDSMKDFEESYKLSLEKKKGERYALFDILRRGKPRKLILEYNLKRKPDDDK